MRIAILADALDQFKIYKDSTFAIMKEAAQRGYEIFTFELSDMVCEGGKVAANIRKVHMLDAALYPKWYELEKSTTEALTNFDVVLVRKDPPFDMEYVFATYLLENASREGARIYNNPRAIRDHNEKCAILEFSHLTEKTLVTRNLKKLHHFILEHEEVILKPLDGMGGSSIFLVRHNDPNKNVILETLTNYGNRTIMAQAYIPEIKEGDKRVLLIAGKPVLYSLARIPIEGETRGNLAAGGTARAQVLAAEDLRIVDALADILWSRGLFLVGLDVIGGYLTEINVTSPTCFQEIFNQTGFNVAAEFLNALEKEVL
ncbi:MAG: glutathione synthase [Pseudomonadota bacterium]